MNESNEAATLMSLPPTSAAGRYFHVWACVWGGGWVGVSERVHACVCIYVLV